MKKIQIYFLFVLITSLGTFLTAIATFLQIGKSFQSIQYLSLAFSLKTLFLMLVGFLIPRIVSTVGFFKSLLMGQFFGIVSLLVLFFSFGKGSPVFILMGLLLSGLPTVALNILSGTLYKLYSKSSDDFRRLQGTQETLIGVCFMASGIAAPLILEAYGFNAVLFIDAVTYIIALTLINFKNVRSLISACYLEKIKIDGVLEKRNWLNLNFFTMKREILFSGFTKFLLVSLATYLLIGIVPVIASSKTTPWAVVLENTTHGLLWTVEAIGYLLGGFIYRNYVNNKFAKKIIKYPFPLALLLVPCLLSKSFVGLSFWLLVLLTLMILKFMKARDDYIINFDSSALILKANSEANIIRNVLMFISPLIILPLVTKGRDPYLIVIIFSAIQLALLALGGVINKYDELQKRTSVA